jgi:chromosome segregation ATPase
MIKTVNLDAAERAFKDAQDRAESLQTNLNRIDRDIDLLIHVKKGLDENLSILKRRQIITVAIEYRKVKEDINKANTNLTTSRINRNNIEHSLAQANKFVVECRDKYLSAMENHKPKVIEVDFGRNSGRQDRDKK